MRPLPARVLVIGGGRMGVGIAHLFAAHGSTVTVCEPGDRDQTLQSLRSSLTRADARGRLGDDLEDVQQRVAIVSDIKDLTADDRASIHLAVEAVPEDLALKCDVLGLIESAVPRGAVIATNTSALPVTEMSAVLHDPTRFVGLHFFNPVPASTLVEIVWHAGTDQRLVDNLCGWVAAVDKQPVVVRDSPGFATSRLGVLLGLEAIRMLEEGVADAESIDRAMELGYKHPMGPLRSTDLVGLDIRLAVAQHLHGALGDRFAPPRMLLDKVAAGDLGRKTGRGFHDWN